MFDDRYVSEIEENVFEECMELRNHGKKIIGVYCAFTPKEIIAAAGGIPVALCAGSQKSVEKGELHLPRNLCPLVKSSYGHALADSCPYLYYSDYILADATCDGKKKMFELLGNMKPLYLLQLPQTAETEESLEYWLKELYKIKELLEKETGVHITDEGLREQIKLYNQFRKSINQVYELNKGEVPLVYGKEIEAITGAVTFECNLNSRIEEIQLAIEKIKERTKNSVFLQEIKNKPRILLTGCPTTNKKLLNIIEESGGVVVAMENCGGLKTTGNLVEETENPMRALGERYLSVACPCMSPNPKRLEIISKIVEDYKIDGVIELTWQACHTYNIEAYDIKRFVTGECNKPYMQIGTDYTDHDHQQIRVRVEAFLELLSE
ncbi:MAG: double-cubane-cluster-containing anaerobic reductase [Marinisporobacter sp.]|jgi:benzoyl-CoA reductase/2-hydroxyglutaryl-CoA dehydratase subunit BcrC/BadD/HgdB|nr:double-cubane-cluster-containing anaerobic reductase [Marinisporobacter sp.]